MPTISTFYGISIKMYWSDHPPPHFHALYAEDEVKIDIRTLEVLEGEMRHRALALVLEWAKEYHDESMQIGNHAQPINRYKEVLRFRSRAAPFRSSLARGGSNCFERVSFHCSIQR